MSVTIQRDGIDIDVDANLEGPDYSVGFDRVWVDEYTAKDPDGNEVELTDSEIDEVIRLYAEKNYEMCREMVEECDGD